MNAFAATNKEILHILSEAEAAETGNLSSSAGTFSLRRARYFSDTVMPPLPAEQQQTLIGLINNGDADAKRQMIADNMQLVVDIAKRYTHRGLPLLDLVREGNQGLIHALENFKPEGGFRFSAYATECIRQNIEIAVMSRNESTHHHTPIVPLSTPLR